ncbi:MAG: TonB-dependent receptor [Cellvibrionaceae bacterium]
MMSSKRIKRFKLKKSAILASSIFSMMCTSNYSLAQSDGVSFLEEIVVTARKVTENLQETPVAVSAFTSESMDRRMIVGTEDLSRVTPNLQFKSYSPLSGNNSAAQVFIRGIGQSDSSGGIDPGVGLYIDDVYMGRSVGGVMDFRDIGNVQVLRGPQGTLFGRNTIGGAVLLTTTAPGDEFGGEVKLGIGDDSLFEFFGALDLPMGDALAARISLGARQRDGYVERIYDGVDLGNEDSYTFNGSLHGDIGDSVDFILRADYTEEDENGSPFVFAGINQSQAFPKAISVANGCPGASMGVDVPDTVDVRCANNATWNLGEYKNGGTTNAESTTENSGLSATFNWDINDLVAFKSITASRNLEWSGSRDADNTALTILSTQYESEADQLSQEFQFLFESDSYNGVIGLFFFKEDIHDNLTVAFALPPAVLPPGDLVGADFQDAELTNENKAIFTNWSFDLSEQLSLSAGLRYTDEEKSMDLIAWGAPFIADPSLNNPASAPFVVSGPVPTTAPPLNIDPATHTESFSATTGSLSLQYQFTDTLMGYVSYAQGFKSGGFNQRYNAPTADFQPIPFDSEEATSFEVGFKSDITDSFRLNGAIFNTEYEDMQLTYRVGIVPLLFNAGESTIRGAELEFTYAPNEVFILEGSFGYLDDEIKSISAIPGATATLGTDNELPFTPEISANIGGAYSFQMGRLMLTPRLDISYTDEQYFDAANSDDVAQSDAETIVNASFKLGDDADVWSVVLGIENLTDETYVVTGNSSFGTSSGYAEVIYSRPRNAYLSASYNF